MNNQFRVRAKKEGVEFARRYTKRLSSAMGMAERFLSDFAKVQADLVVVERRLSSSRAAGGNWEHEKFVKKEDVK